MTAEIQSGSPADHEPLNTTLLAIVEVEKSAAVQCQHSGCNHRVYKRIHVVDESGQLMVLGSTCLEKRYGSGTVLGTPSIGGANGRRLTSEERQMLIDNTESLLAQFRQEYENSRVTMVAKLHALKAQLLKSRPVVPLPSPAPLTAQTTKPLGNSPWHQAVKRPPWPWVKPHSSMAYFHLKDGAAWVRVQNIQGVQMLMPWPAFEGWEEFFPASVGTPLLDVGGYQVPDIIYAVRYLRERSDWDRVGVWSEVVPSADSVQFKNKKPMQPFSIVQTG